MISTLHCWRVLEVKADIIVSVYSVRNLVLPLRTERCSCYGRGVMELLTASERFCNEIIAIYPYPAYEVITEYVNFYEE